MIIFIENEKEINLDAIGRKDKIGIMAGASTPEESIKKVVSKLGKIIDWYRIIVELCDEK